MDFPLIQNTRWSSKLRTRLNDPLVDEVLRKLYVHGADPDILINSRPHVGSSYTTIVCDVIARYKRMCGYDVALLVLNSSIPASTAKPLIPRVDKEVVVGQGDLAQQSMGFQQGAAPGQQPTQLVHGDVQRSGQPSGTLHGRDEPASLDPGHGRIGQLG